MINEKTIWLFILITYINVASAAWSIPIALDVSKIKKQIIELQAYGVNHEKSD